MTKDFTETDITNMFNMLNKKSQLGSSNRRASNRPLTAGHNRTSPQKHLKPGSRKPAWAKGKDQTMDSKESSAGGMTLEQRIDFDVLSVAFDNWLREEENINGLLNANALK